MEEEKIPVSDIIKVVESATVYKTDKWWSAVCLIESFGRKQVAVYLWNKKGDSWKRRQKFIISNKGHWEKVKGAIDTLVAKI